MSLVYILYVRGNSGHVDDTDYGILHRRSNILCLPFCVNQMRNIYDVLLYYRLRPPAGRQYRMPISQQPFNRSLPNFQQLLLVSNEGKVEKFSSFAYG